MRTTKVRRSRIKKTSAVAAPKRRGRPPGKRALTMLAAAPVKRGRGRPKSPQVQQRKAQKERELKQKLRGQIKNAKVVVKSVRAELKAVLKREKRLKKLFVTQQDMVGQYLQRWHARQIKKLDKQPQRRRRRVRRS